MSLNRIYEVIAVENGAQQKLIQKLINTWYGGDTQTGWTPHKPTSWKYAKNKFIWYIEQANKANIWPISLLHLWRSNKKHILLLHFKGNRDSLVGTATGYGLKGRVSIPDRGKNFFSTPQRPDRLRGPLSLLSSGYRGLFRLRMVKLFQFHGRSSWRGA
jgi:hypothetical protein